ncbi:hypothetical protein AA313_de0200470 [Arthrobotrys entomopaga]|nr:hypothetical protein AA313_de0200470 [Arthrobotrys entomopaga]
MKLSVSVPYLELRERGAPYISRSSAPENIELASTIIILPKPASSSSSMVTDHLASAGGDPDSEIGQFTGGTMPPGNGKGYYALKSAREMIFGVDGLAEVDTPKILVLTAVEVGEIEGFGNLKLKIDEIGVDDVEVITFDMLNDMQKAAAIEWSGCNPDGSGYENAVASGGWKKMRRVLNKYGLQFEERSQFIKWAGAHEVDGLRRYIEQQPVFEQAQMLLQSFRRLFNKTLTARAQDTSVSFRSTRISRTMWVQFGIETTVSRPAYQRSLHRVKAMARHPRYLDAREALNVMDWDKAMHLCPILSPSFGSLNSPLNFLRERKRKRRYCSSSSSDTSSNSHSDCETERCRDISPISIYADTECRSPCTEENNAAYKARHAMARIDWPQHIRDSCTAERQPSPSSSSSSEDDSSGKEDGIEEEEWPVVPGRIRKHYHGRFSGVVEMVAGGVPGGMDFGLVRSDGRNSGRGVTRRLKNKASFRPGGSSSDGRRKRERKRLKKFPPSEIIGIVTEENIDQVLHVVHNDGVLEPNEGAETANEVGTTEIEDTEDEQEEEEEESGGEDNEDEEVFDDALQEEPEE